MDVRPWLDRSSVRARLPSSDKASADQVLCSMFIRPSTLSLLGNVLSFAVDGCNSDTSPGSIDLMVLEFINKNLTEGSGCWYHLPTDQSGETEAHGAIFGKADLYCARGFPFTGSKQDLVRHLA